MENSKIGWTHHTFNPWIGCNKVSPACANCYAELLDLRWGNKRWGADAPRDVTGVENWRKPVTWNRKAIEEGERKRVFCASLADVFETRADLEDPRARLRRLIDVTPSLDWLLLTKRPEDVESLASKAGMLNEEGRFGENVWMGTTIENQEWAEKRLPHLLQLKADIHFVSMEPLLGPVNLREIKLANGDILDALTGEVFDPRTSCVVDDSTYAALSWVIVGGESGGKWRPMEEGWVRDILAQCKRARLGSIPFFYKQTAAFHPNKEPLLDSARYAEFPR